MKIIRLLVSDMAPLYPPLWGGPKRIWNLYSNLGDDFDVTYIGISCGLRKRYISRKIRDNFREVVRPITKIYYLFKYFEAKVLRNRDFDIFVHLCAILDKGLKRELDNCKADILIASHPWISVCFKAKKSRVFVYDAHNCEYMLIKEILKGRWYKSIVSLFVKLIEKSACKKADVIIAASGSDKELFVKLYGVAEKKIFIVPNGASIKDNPSYEGRKKTKVRLRIIDDNPMLLFIGTRYKPNKEAAQFIINEVAPRLPGVEIVLVGAVNEYFRNTNTQKNVRLVGSIGDAELYEWLTAADIGINPMFSGSGISMKMLDYFSFGLPVVTTWHGARGISGINYKDFIACKEKEFVDTIKFLLCNENLRENIGRSARNLAEEIYDWKKISGELSRILSDTIKCVKV